VAVAVVATSWRYFELDFFRTSESRRRLMFAIGTDQTLK
jgi:hypothetical protein